MTTDTRTTTRIVLRRTPSGPLRLDDLEEETIARPVPAAGEVLVRTLYAIVAPGQRAFMNGDTFRAGLEVGDVVPGNIVGEVVETCADGPEVGAIVECFGAWAGYVTGPAAALRVVGESPVPLVERLGLLGPNGIAAYSGIHDVAHVRSGETVVISAAAGAVGHLAGQLAGIAGARVVGVTGSATKNRALVDELGFDAAVDRRSPTFADDLRAACPDGVDVYFDSVGGTVLETVLPVMNVAGRIACCGSVSEYDTDETGPGSGVAGIPMLVTTKRLTLRGFLVDDFADSFDEAVATLTGWYVTGRITPRTTVHEGLASAPAALLGNLAGENLGQTVIRVSAEAGR